MAGWLVLAKNRDRQLRAHQLHLDAQVWSTACAFTQALRERLRWLSSHAGFESPLLNKLKRTTNPKGSL